MRELKRDFVRGAEQVSVAKLRAAAAHAVVVWNSRTSSHFFRRDGGCAALARLIRTRAPIRLDRLAVGSSLSRRRLFSCDKPQIEPESVGLGKLDSHKVRVCRIQNVVPFPDNYRRDRQNC